MELENNPFVVDNVKTPKTMDEFMKAMKGVEFVFAMDNYLKAQAVTCDLLGISDAKSIPKSKGGYDYWGKQITRGLLEERLFSLVFRNMYPVELNGNIVGLPCPSSEEEYRELRGETTSSVAGAILDEKWKNGCKAGFSQETSTSEEG